MPTTSPRLAVSRPSTPLFAAPVLLIPAPPTVIVIPVSMVEVGPEVGIGEATALKVVATEYDAGAVARMLPLPAQNPPRALIVAYTLGSAACA